MSYKNVSATTTPLLEIIEENNYYPFGLKHKGYNNVSTSSNIALKRMFGGKEYQDELGLGWYDVSARNYDPALGRWMNLDPLAENGRRHSPYNYAFDNPVYFIDYDGMWPGPGDEVKRTSSDNQSTAVVRKAKSIWNSLKTIGNVISNPALGPALALQATKNTLASAGSTGLSIVNNGLVSTAKDIVGTNIRQIAGEEGISHADAAEVFGTGVMLDVAVGIGTEGLSALPAMATRTANIIGDVNNPVPSRLARVIPGDIENPSSLGITDQVFVTAANDIKGMNATQIAERLTIPQSASGFNVIEFDTPLSGLSTPIKSNSPGFIGGGQTAGGAREFTLPNFKLSELNAKSLEIRW